MAFPWRKGDLRGENEIGSHMKKWKFGEGLGMNGGRINA